MLKSFLVYIQKELTNKWTKEKMNVVEVHLNIKCRQMMSIIVHYDQNNHYVPTQYTHIHIWSTHVDSSHLGKTIHYQAVDKFENQGVVLSHLACFLHIYNHYAWYPLHGIYFFFFLTVVVVVVAIAVSIHSLSVLDSVPLRSSTSRNK